MTWGPSFMYYTCPSCGKKFKYALDMIAEFGDDYGHCPACKIMGTYVMDGPRTKDDADYEEVDE